MGQRKKRNINNIISFYINSFNNSFVKKKLVKAKKFNIPIICIGNIYIGGTERTPTSIYVGNELKKLNRKPVILRKFYRNHDDEHSLIKKYHEDLILTNSREEGILTAQKKF